MNESQNRVTAAYLNLLHMSIYANNLLSIVSFGLHHALRDHNYFSKPLQAIAPHLCGVELERISGISREVTLDHSTKGARAACLIFIHAGCEAALCDVAKASALDTARWNDIIAKKQILISEVLEGGVDKVFQRKINEYLVEFERDTLIRKTRTLFRVLRPDENSLEDYIFSEEKLIRIDSLRHRCAHGGCDVADFSTFEADVAYLRDTGEYFVRSAAKIFNVDLPVVPEKMEFNHFKGLFRGCLESDRN